MSCTVFRSPALSALCLVALSVVPSVARAGEFGTPLPMVERGARTFYIAATLGSLENEPFMVDTGSSYLTINRATLAHLESDGLAHYLRDRTGRLADGSEVRVPIYRVATLRLGGQCVLHDVEAAVFPGGTRQIIGLNVLNRTAPFIFSVDPPQLVLSHCDTGPAAAS